MPTLSDTARDYGVIESAHRNEDREREGDHAAVASHHVVVLYLLLAELRRDDLQEAARSYLQRHDFGIFACVI